MAAVPSLASAGPLSSKLNASWGVGSADGRSTRAAELLEEQGYLVPDQHAYEREKARATRRALSSESLAGPLQAPTSGSLAPNAIRQFAGINDRQSAPPDETSAVGRTRYIELVNRRFAIYNKTGNAPINQGTLNSLGGAPSSVNVFDPQIIWDATTNRFYFATDAVVTDGVDNRVTFGFSKTASPASAADWCKHNISTGSVLADYPKLGDSQHFIIIGTNLFAASGNFLGSNIMAASKPRANDTCATYENTFKFNDANVAANSGFTPMAVNEIDTNPTGWVVARASSLPSTKLSLYKVTRSASGNPVIQTRPTRVTVPNYTGPPSAPQQGSVNPIDTLDGRITQGVGANDPSKGGTFAIWTQHTVRGGFGGPGAGVRWYEINPAAHSLLRRGEATSPSLFEFNGAISPNRRVSGQNRGGGNAMVMNFNASSSAAKVSIRMLSQGREQPAVRPGRGAELAGAALRVRLLEGRRARLLPLGRLRGGHTGSTGQPDLEREPVRRRLGKRDQRSRDLPDLELHRQAVGAGSRRSCEKPRSAQAERGFRVSPPSRRNGAWPPSDSASPRAPSTGPPSGAPSGSPHDEQRSRSSLLSIVML